MNNIPTPSNEEIKETFKRETGLDTPNPPKHAHEPMFKWTDFLGGLGIALLVAWLISILP